MHPNLGRKMWSFESYWDYPACREWSEKNNKNPGRYLQTKEWRMLRDKVMRRAKAVCEMCYYPMMWPPGYDRREEGPQRHPDERAAPDQELRDAVELGKGGHLYVPYLEVHHLTYDNFGNENMEDVIAVCGWCHKKLEAEKRKEKRKNERR